jgi:protein-disulfide isomerase
MPMKERIDSAATIILTLCALVVTGLLLHRHFADPPEVVTAAPQVENWRDYAAEGHRRGPEGAPVTIVVFSDFQCPACRVFSGYLPELFEEFEGRLAVVYRHYPLPTHAHAVPAARAAECAAAQGAFDPFHDAVFAWQDSLGTWPWARFAAEARVSDAAGLERCVEEEVPLPALQRDTLAARRLGVTGTPTLLVNGRRFHGVPPLEVLRAQVMDEMRDVRGR